MQVRQAAGPTNCRSDKLQVRQAVGSINCWSGNMQVWQAAGSTSCRSDKLQVRQTAGPTSCRSDKPQVRQAVGSVQAAGLDKHAGLTSCRFRQAAGPTSCRSDNLQFRQASVSLFKRPCKVLVTGPDLSSKQTIQILRLSDEYEGLSRAKPCRPDIRHPAGSLEQVLCNPTEFRPSYSWSCVDPVACRTVWTMPYCHYFVSLLSAFFPCFWLVWWTVAKWSLYTISWLATQLIKWANKQLWPWPSAPALAMAQVWEYVLCRQYIGL